MNRPMTRCRWPLIPGGFGLLVLLAGSTPARAGITEGLLQLAGGRADCRSKRFASGVKKLLTAAVTIQQADPKHAANRRWLPQVRRCLRSWMKSTAGACRRAGRIDSLKTFFKIRKQIKYVSAPVVKRLLKGRIRTCASQVAKRATRECLEAPGARAIAVLAKEQARLTALGVDKKQLTVVLRGMKSCAYKWVQEAKSRCQTNPTVAVLKEIGVGISQVDKGRRTPARKAYEVCAKELGKRGWVVCQSRLYRKGRGMLKEAIARYGYYGAKDKRFLQKMKRTWLPRCGTYLLSGYFNGRIKRGAVIYTASVKVHVEVTRTGKGRALVGRLHAQYSAVQGLKRGCRVMITPRDGSYSVVGTENRAKGTVFLKLDPGRPHTTALEEVQVICGERAPVLFKTTWVHQLLGKAKLLRLSMGTRPRFKRRFAYRGGLGSGGKGSFGGNLVLTHLK